jgi:ribosomal protein L16 Arg81 hydroxylase
MTLDDVLAPVTVEAFFRDYLGERAVVIKGVPGRFHGLLSWSQLNDALSSMRAESDRVSLVKHAQKPVRESYVVPTRSGAPHYLHGPAVMEHIAAGATLSVNYVDLTFPDIRRLAERLEKLFRIFVNVNLYAGWRRDNGFDVHWDKHDTLILQVRGRKEWKVWHPTREHPMEGDLVPSPTAEPFWHGILEDGDVLYMPRGWWHVAYPRDEPTLHLTLGLHHPTGIDLLTWAVDRMRETVEARMDVPHWRDAERQRGWLDPIREAWASVLDERVIEEYMTAREDRARPRPVIRLPETSIADPVPTLNDQTKLRLVMGTKLHLRSKNGTRTLSFTARGGDWTCDEALRPALALLNHIEPCTLAEMRQVVDDRGRILLRPYLTGLLMARIIWAEPAGSPPHSFEAEGPL